ncbi:hydrogen gas-evolving membrane-bound hydrogenase subunit E [Thiomicrorhabdus indica]|uniref:hydrogen gas-evolving membrane-bound hydrogenase subunit E n=1 Tax=Thiomicrorhabdus indica TaxID=2267253 RepID=UPI002AA8FD04|nr:hydrogen gas-evolving membrane-bound hydrogenase subunit E [Thiomicrorhabdus indica]
MDYIKEEQTTAKHSESSVESTQAWLWLSLLTFGLFSALIYSLLHYELPWRLSLPWIPSLNIHLNFYIDAFSALLLILITGIGSMVFLYSAGYFKHTKDHQRILITLPLFMLAMMGAVSADDVILLFVFWELTSITSFLMVGFKHEDAKTRFYARQALFASMGGGMAMLGGLILLANLSGTWSLSGIIQAAPNYLEAPELNLAIVLILLGAFTKSAQFPFHFWLPNAMSAPTPVSAYLHSATMVKLGIYLMARFDVAFNNLFLWELLLISTGIVTATWAAILALRERDLKRILARSTLSALGILTLLIGLPSANAGLAVIAFLFAHAVYKAPLFMIAGNIDHATGTRIIDELMGLRKKMPVTSLIAIIAALSMAGLPLAYGFVAKDLVSDAKEQADLITLVSYSLVFVNAAAIAVAAVAAIRIFWGPIHSSMHKVKEVSWMMFTPPLLLAIFGIEFDALPDYRDPLLLSAAQSISPSLQINSIQTEYTQDLLVATTITLLIGIFLFFAWDKVHDSLSRWRWLDTYGPEASYDKALQGLQWVAARHTQILQSGRLSRYHLLTVLFFMVFALALIWQMPASVFENWQANWQGYWVFPEQLVAWTVAMMLMVIASLATVMLRNNLAALMASGVIGYGAAILFLFSGAPDLAFTQFMMETILVVVVALSLPLFEHTRLVEASRLHWGRLSISTLAAIGVFMLLMLLPEKPADVTLAQWFSQNSLPLAQGHNVVNVIIVDFRALDTFGEIAVVAFSLLAAMPLLIAMAKISSGNASNAYRVQNPQSYLLNQLATPIYWLLVIASVVVVFRGHNNPGGGFIGGLMAVAASAWLAIQHSPKEAEKWQGMAADKLALFGVFLAMLAGVIGWWLNGSFLEHVWYGAVSTVLLFDMGVYLAVWGGLSGYIYKLLSIKPTLDTRDRETLHTESQTPANQRRHR